MCTRAPASRASSASRATIDSSAARGHPDSPSLAAVGPSWATAPTVSLGSSACWAISTPRPVAYSRARRITSGSCTQMPSSENIRTCAAPAAIMPISVSSAPASPTVTAPTGCTSTRPTCWPRCQTWSVTTGLSATGVGVGHREHRGVAAQSRCGRTGFDVLGVFAARLAQVGVQVDESGQQHLTGGVDDVGVFGDRPRSSAPISAIWPSSTSTSTRSPSPYSRTPRSSTLMPHPRFRPIRCRPARGTAPPSARAHRWKPVAAQPIAMSRPPTTRSPCRAASAPGAAPRRGRAASPGADRKARRATEYSRTDGKKPPFIRSACTRSISTASAAGSSASKSWDTVTGQPSTPTGSSVGGATSTTSAPRVCSSMTLERATRLCRMSPTITTRRPSMPPSRWRIVSASSSACVGCSWVPSPALITDGPSPSARRPVGEPVRGARTPGAG